MNRTPPPTRTTEQLEAWQGAFGRAYTERNRIDPNVRREAFRDIIEDRSIRRVLEVGCNRGHNLVAWAELLGPGSEICGVEPNPYALQLARNASAKINVVQGTAFDLPFEDDHFDLVFTSGVLIHIALADLPRALSEMVRVSRRFLLSIEYFAPQETVIPYRDRDDLLWKRDFLGHYQSQFSDLTLVRSGKWTLSDEDADFWLLAKPARQNR